MLRSLLILSYSISGLNLKNHLKNDNTLCFLSSYKKDLQENTMDLFLLY